MVIKGSYKENKVIRWSRNRFVSHFGEALFYDMLAYWVDGRNPKS